MASYYCYGCGVYIHIPLNCDEDEEYDYNDECCENAYWVDYNVKIRALKNLKKLKNKMWAYTTILKEYKMAKERIKYAPYGIGFYEAFEEFETLRASKKRSLYAIDNSNCIKCQKS